jgi:hypothetical protein
MTAAEVLQLIMEFAIYFWLSYMLFDNRKKADWLRGKLKRLHASHLAKTNYLTALVLVIEREFPDFDKAEVHRVAQNLTDKMTNEELRL